MLSGAPMLRLYFAQECLSKNPGDAGDSTIPSREKEHPGLFVFYDKPAE